MKTSAYFVGAVVAAIVAMPFLPAQSQDHDKEKSSAMPAGWMPAGDRPKDYIMGVDQGVRREGKASAFIKSEAEKIRGFTTMMQTVSADKYTAKRIQFSGWLKTDSVEEFAMLWMRVDGENGKILAFDNMQDRPVTGTTDWKYCNVVLDSPSDAQDISFGFMISGKGKVWANGLEFKTVGSDVPVTSQTKKKKYPAEPVNLDFSSKKE